MFFSFSFFLSWVLIIYPSIQSIEIKKEDKSLPKYKKEKNRISFFLPWFLKNIPCARLFYPDDRDLWLVRWLIRFHIFVLVSIIDSLVWNNIKIVLNKGNLNSASFCQRKKKRLAIPASNFFSKPCLHNIEYDATWQAHTGTRLVQPVGWSTGGQMSMLRYWDLNPWSPHNCSNAWAIVFAVVFALFHDIIRLT